MVRVHRPQRRRAGRREARGRRPHAERRVRLRLHVRRERRSRRALPVPAHHRDEHRVGRRSRERRTTTSGSTRTPRRRASSPEPMDNTPSYFYGAVIALQRRAHARPRQRDLPARLARQLDRRLRRRSRPTSCSTCCAGSTRPVAADRDRHARRAHVVTASEPAVYKFLMPAPRDPDTSLTPGLAEWSGAPSSSAPDPADTGRNGAHGADRRAHDRQTEPAALHAAAAPAPRAAASRRRAAARQPALPAEEQAARPAAAHRAARARAPRQAHRARGVRVRQPVVVGVRHRGDAAGPDPGRSASARSRSSCRSRSRCSSCCSS